MPPGDEDALEEIALRLERRADHYQNAGDQARAGQLRDAAGSVRGASSLVEARAIEADSQLGTPRRSPWRRFWDGIFGGPRDDS
jgi:hypothetical protein